MAFDLFEGLKVLDLGQGISAPFCAKMFADLGARVVKVEPPAGDVARLMGPFPDDHPDPERSGLYLALNTNKQGVTLDLETSTGRELLLQLAAEADLLIENFPPAYLPSLELDFATLQERNPRLVLTSVTPFGQTGPWANYQANNLIISNLSGFAREHPGPVDDLAKQPPLQLAAHQAEFVAGVNAAAAAALALNRRRRDGQGCHVDVSAVESLALLPQTTLTEFALGVAPRGRHKSVARLESLRAILPCRDGYVSISPRQEDQWQRFVAMMDHPQWADDPKFATRDDRVSNWKDLEPLLSDWTSRHSKEEVYREAQANHIPSFPLNTAADLFSSAQFQAREFFVEAEHPAAGKLPYPGWPIQLGSGRRFEVAPAPLLGQDNQAVLGDAATE
jgi:crotonobetainyl-CoA:carnitine CoA-transferase CaiB-like acyl-CoA transferase